MSKLKSVGLAGALTLAALVLVPAPASAKPSRQYYSGWRQNKSAGYSYRTYYYKPRASYSGYKHHYVIYNPKYPKYYYYYNPYKKHYWGRCSVDNYDGEGYYSKLPDKYCKASLDDIPEKAFPKPGKMPRIPEGDDEEVMDLPPDDLPSGKTGPPRGKPVRRDDD
jgi:hypothetical protein